VTLRLNHENVDRYLRRAATDSTRAQ
jgi:hypothetical protein